MGKWQPPFGITFTEKPNKPGTWSSQNVKVLNDECEEVGNYVYNYHSTPPFYPFKLENKWYALFSKHYTASAIMELPSCKIIWEEKSDSYGFCPVNFYVPAVQKTDFCGDRTGKLTGTWEKRLEHFEVAGKDEKHNWIVREPEYYPFGFSCGCIWGDDTSWKVRFFDFTKIKDKIINYDDRFGYIELHNKLNLQESIDIWGNLPGEDFNLDKVKISITTNKIFNFKGEELKDE